MSGRSETGRQAGTGRQASSSRSAVLYLGLWLTMAALAIGYTVTLFVDTSPGKDAEKIASQSETTLARLDELAAAVAQQASDQKAMDDRLGQVFGALKALKTEVADLAANSDVLASRLDQIAELTVKPIPASAGAAKKHVGVTVPPPSSEADAAIGTADIVEAASSGGEPAKPKAKPAAKPTTSAGDETASVTPPAAPEKKKEKKYGLELAQSASTEALRLNWDLLTERHSALLKGLSARAATAGADDYRLVAGPFSSAEAAQAACAKLKAADISCKPTGFGGAPL